MLAYLLQGIFFGLIAAVQPGPLQVYMIIQSIKNGWRRTIVYAIVPLLSDVPIIALVLFVLALMPAAWVTGLRFVGGAFLLYLAVRAFRAAQTLPADPDAEEKSSPRGLFQAVLINLLNPNPYLFWSLVTGPILLAGWKESPINGIGLLAGFYATMILINAAIITVVSIAHMLNPRLRRILIACSAAGLAFFGVYQIYTGMTAIFT